MFSLSWLCVRIQLGHVSGLPFSTYPLVVVHPQTPDPTLTASRLCPAGTVNAQQHHCRISNGELEQLHSIAEREVRTLFQSIASSKLLTVLQKTSSGSAGGHRRTETFVNSGPALGLLDCCCGGGAAGGAAAALGAPPGGISYHCADRCRGGCQGRVVTMMTTTTRQWTWSPQS